MKEGDIAAVIGSPPYAESEIPSPASDCGNKRGRSQTVKIDERHYGTTPGQLGSMREGDISAVISSPPWENQEPSHAQGTGFQPAYDGNRKFIDSEYGNSRGNIGNSSGETFWESSKIIVQGCYALLKPGGHAIWVCKDYVKAKKRVPFSDRWQALCESVGFTLVCRHQAMLVENHGIKTSLMGVDEEINTERKSFFRRLAEKKGSPRIDFEDVLCFVKEK
jgi:hypothetical protein